MSPAIHKNGCWGCLRAREDPTEKFVCPQIQQHWAAAEKQEFYLTE